MKNLFFAILITSLCSCSSTNKIVQDYLEEEIKNDTIKENVLYNEKISFSEAFRIFQGMRIRSKSEEELKINEELRNNYLLEVSENWKKIDFKKINFEIIKKDSIDKFIYNRIKEYKYFAYRFNVYSVSKPYFYNKNKNVFFNIKKFRIDNKGEYDDAIIMKKIKGKWVLVEKRSNNDL